MKFNYSSEECELLLAFEECSSISDLAQKIGRDTSVVSRNLKALSLKSRLLEKHNGRWVITDQGKELNKWTRDAIFSQTVALNKQSVLRVACPREFAVRILTPGISKLIAKNDVSIEIISTDSGIESLLLSGKADFGFDCGRPEDPLISFKRVIDESFSVVASEQYLVKNKVKSFAQLNVRDRLSFSRSENEFIEGEPQATRYFGRFSDIATLREACILGHGWSILPTYTVKNELSKNMLKTVKGFKIENQRYGIWWPRERRSILPWIEKAEAWLSKQKLT